MNNNKRWKKNEDEGVPESYLQVIRSIGNTPEDIGRWRAERRARFPRTVMVTKKTAPALSAMFAAYATDDDDEEDEEQQVLEKPSTTTTTTIVKSIKPCVYFTRNGRCRYGEKCKHQHSTMSQSSQDQMPKSLEERSSHHTETEKVGGKAAALRSQNELLRKLLDDVSE